MFLKKIVLIILIAVLAFSQAGYYFVMHNFQYGLKEEMQAVIHNQLTSKDIEIVSYTDNQQKIYWEEEGKEFLYKGEMYDVVKSKIEKGKVLLYCINDKKEKQLVDNYNSITKNNSAAGKKAKAIVDNSATLFVYEPENLSGFFTILPANNFHIFISHLAEANLQNSSPPPENKI